MNVMSSHSVVDRIAADLAERRRSTIYRNGAYLALARAIMSDETAEQCVPGAECQPTSVSQSQTAA
jgi:hypothetical protein